MQGYAPKSQEVPVPVSLTPTEIKTLLEALGELPYVGAGERSATEKLKAALK